jgi:serine-type D-Ala-D-Ala carboxypeptidase (penicillin-binding protein 5/6)
MCAEAGMSGTLARRASWVGKADEVVGMTTPANVMASCAWRTRLISVAAIVSALLLTAAIPARATYKTQHRHAFSHHHRRVHAHRVHTRTVLYHALLLEDADTGRILYDYNGGIQWPPASMAKMMLLMVVEDQIKAGRFRLDSPVTITAQAAYTGGSRLGLHAGQVVPLGDLMKAALIRSANDAAVAIADGVCGSTARCVEMMNARARSLGMMHTTYGTVEGLPPQPLHDVDSTDAYDLATLARALIHQTNLLQWSALETASFDDGAEILHNTNHLIGHFEGCDGLKTGFTIKAGFNLTATAERGNMRFVAVVLGAPSNAQRFVQAAKLLDWGFDNFEKVEVVKEGQLLPMQVRVGANEVMQPVAGRTVTVIVPKKDADQLKMDFAVPASLYGPLASDQTVGQVIVRDRSEVVTRFDAVCPLPIGQQPVAVGGSSVGAARIPGERGSTIRVAAPAGQAAAPVTAVAGPINAATAPTNQIATPVR